MERKELPGNPLMGNEDNIDHVHELSLSHDFMEVPDFEQFIDLIRGDSYVYDNGTNFAIDNNFQYCVPNQPFEVADAANAVICDPNSFLDSFFEEEEKLKIGEKGDKDREYSLETVNADDDTSTTPRKGSISTKGDRSKTLISERRRRGRMKEKLYQLRALVPNITKMDKASIIGDATLYVQELQMRAKKLRAQIATLESSLAEADKPQQQSYQSTKKTHEVNSYSTSKKIAKMELVQVGEKGVYVKLVCEKGKGVAVSLYKALESSTISMDVENSNLVSVAESFVLTFTLNVGKMEVNLANLKLCVAGAFVKQGFDFETSLQP